jgi:hypothetical protein
LTIFEYNYIETLVGNPSSAWDWIKPLAGVVVGFGLKYGFDKHEEFEKRKITAETFQYEMKSFEQPIKKQIVMLKMFRQAVNDGKSSTLSNFLKLKFGTIKQLNRLDLVHYFIKKRGKTTSYISTAYNSIELLESEMERLEKNIDEYINGANSEMNFYYSHLRQIYKIDLNYYAAIEKEQVKSSEIDKEEQALFEKYFLNMSISVNYLITLKDTFHNELTSLLSGAPRAEYYNSIREFNVQGIAIINKLLHLKATHLTFLQQVEEAFLRIYNRMYEKEINFDDVEFNIK